MQDLQSLEIFEIEILEYLNSTRILDRLFFGGGTMLRLCHNLRRFSTDLDFWIKQETDSDILYKTLSSLFASKYEVLDKADKNFTILFQLRSSIAKRTLKIEIRKDITEFDWERKIAFSKFSVKQVQVNGLTLEQMMKNKISALQSRKLIRDCHDIDFMFKRGIHLPEDKTTLKNVLEVINSFKDKDYKVILGSLLEPEERHFYINNKFSQLKVEIEGLINSEN